MQDFATILNSSNVEVWEQSNVIKWYKENVLEDGVEK